MKLNYKNTILVGFSFLAICAFWQMYNNVIPLILTNTFHMNETVSGVIMAADNVLALFLLPLFGGLSDKCKSKMGRRKPFILGGTIASVIIMMFLPLLDNSYFNTPNTITLVLFVVALGGLLVSMGTFRSPAVALMPDVTPKPLRSMGNAVINLMGALGVILYLGITALLYSQSRTAGLDHVSYVLLFAIVAGIMLVALAVLMLCVDEPKLCKIAEELEANELGNVNDDSEIQEDNNSINVTKMDPAVKRSLISLLLSISLWYIGYNAMETWFTTFAEKTWGMALGSASLCLTIGSVGAIISYIPIGHIAGKIGRKKTILFGVILLSLSFLSCFVITLTFDSFTPLLYIVFLLVGLSWAAINVNSFPMVVEICTGDDVGKYTGMYYTFSMAAQTITPIISGWLLKNVGYYTLFLYSTITVGCAFFTMIMVKHGDTTLGIKKGLEAFDVED